jgi:D-glycero-D-manno-heptose 1,7-bisphosphate phosphatase
MKTPPVDAVFLDRDGTLIEEVNYLYEVDQIRLVPGAAEAIRQVNVTGTRLIVVTNQSGVARGLFPEERVTQVHARLMAMLQEQGARVDACYYCPHHPIEGIGKYRVDCDCRKPKPGMLLAAARDLGLDLTQSWMIGDKISDLEAGAAAGCRTVLVQTGYGASITKSLPANELRLAGVVTDLPAAIDIWQRHRKTKVDTR